jgi:CRP-like cAMP-binding protein
VNAKRLQGIPFFEGLGEEVVNAVAARGQEASASEGDVLVRAGDYSNDLTIIVEGSARVEMDGRELATLGPGDIYGEAGVLTKEQRNATVTANDDMRLVVLSDFDVRRIRGEHPGFGRRVEQVAAQRSG